MTGAAAAPAPIKPILVTKELFEQAYIERYEQTVRLLVHAGYRRQDAEDFGQTAWARAWEFRHQFDGRNGSSLATWVGVIALNVARGWARLLDTRKMTGAVGLGGVETTLSIPGFEAEVGARIDVERLMRGDGLTKRERELLELTYINKSIEVSKAISGQSKVARRLAVMRARRSAMAWFESGGSNVR